jgi:hypothetical protein
VTQANATPIINAIGRASAPRGSLDGVTRCE